MLTIKVFLQHAKEAFIRLASLFPAEIDGDWFRGREGGEVEEGGEEEGEGGLGVSFFRGRVDGDGGRGRVLRGEGSRGGMREWANGGMRGSRVEGRRA